MRKQYHLRPTANGFDAWDVDRLIDLACDLPVEDIPLSSISEVDRDYWFTESGEDPTVRKIAEHARLITEVDASHPIILGPDGRMMDGMHRVARALIDGRETIRAVRLGVLPEPDYRDCHPHELPYDRG